MSTAVDPATCSTLSKLYRAYNTPSTFQLGDIVRWKPHMRTRKNPPYSSYAIVTRVYQRPLYDPAQKEPGSCYFHEPLTGAIAFFDSDGDFTEDPVDMNRFEHVPPEEFEATKGINRGIICDGCGKRDFPGARFHCKRCENFDFCPDCQARGVEIKGHLRSHEMLMMEPYGIRLQVLCQRLLTPSNLQPGDIVRWKEGLRNKKRPAYDEFVVVLDVLSVPIISKSEGVYFAEPLDCKLGYVDGDGDLLTFFFDSRRFEKAVQ